jgi:DNA-binding winged helix-turn-helix (wHTH) protein
LILRFAKYALDVDGRSLTNRGREIALRPQALELLCYLAKNPGRPIPKEELFREIWPGLYVTDDSLVQCVRDIRRALDDDHHRLIKTLPRRGYLFAGAISESEDSFGSDSSPHASITSPPRLLTIKLILVGAIAVLVVWGIVHWFVSGH